MNPTRRWILAGLIVALACLVIALMANRSPTATVEPLLGDSTAPGEVTADERSAEPPPRHDRKLLDEPPPDVRPAERGPVILAGRIVDDLGAAVAGGDVTASPNWHRSLKPDDLSWKEWTRIEESRIRQMRADTNLATCLFEDGRFEVRGWTTARMLQVDVRRGQQLVTRVFDVGTRGIRLKLPRVGSVHALIVHDEGISSRAFQLSLSRDVNTPPIELSQGRYQGRGHRTFSSERVPVGSYALAVQLHKHSQPLLRLDGIEVRAEERCSDERLQRIDTRGLCRRVVVKLMRPNGSSLPLPACLDAEVTVRDPNGEPLPVQPVIRRSRIELTTRYPYIDLRVNLRHYRALHLPVLSASREVFLEPN